MASARILVDSVESAAETLLRVLEHARNSRDNYDFGPVHADSVFSQGLQLDGDIARVLEDVLTVPGVLLTE